MFWKFFTRKFKNFTGLYPQNYVDARVLYTLHFDEVPSIAFLGMIDGGKALDLIMSRYEPQVSRFMQHCYFDYEQQDLVFNCTVLVLTNGRIIEVTANYCLILHSNANYAWVQQLVKDLARFKVEEEETNQQVIGFARQQMAE